MAHGYPDSWIAPKAILPMPYIGQTLWYLQGQGSVAPDASATLVGTAVPAGEALFITGGVVTCNFPVQQRYRFYTGTEWSRDIYFDTQALLPFNPSAMLQLETGQAFGIILFNDDSATHNLAAFILGFRLTFDPTVDPSTGLGEYISRLGV